MNKCLTILGQNLILKCSSSNNDNESNKLDNFENLSDNFQRNWRRFEQIFSSLKQIQKVMILKLKSL